MDSPVIIIGSGAAGLSAALELAENKIPCVIIADMPSERSESVMAEGGMNAALDGINDSPALHAEDTYKAGRFIANRRAVDNMCAAAPDIVRRLIVDGMCFTMGADGTPALRAFGGQSRRRTVFAGTSTGKQLMSTLIMRAQRFEADGLITRLTCLHFLRLIISDGCVLGCYVVPAHGNEILALYGSVIIASGGMNGLFGSATGSVANTGYAAASLFADGVPIVNGEFIQYHPTTAQLRGKNMLISEAVRGEGGRLFVYRDGKPYYFMEELYPERGNLMPRDVIAREEWSMQRDGRQVYLDMRHLDRQLCAERLGGVLRSCRELLGLDSLTAPIPVTPGIHYFMGGIKVDVFHRSSLRGLYAAGECSAIYHGANRLGGNSLTGALYGGITAARSAIDDMSSLPRPFYAHIPEYDGAGTGSGNFAKNTRRLQEIMRSALGIVRDGDEMLQALHGLDELAASAAEFDGSAELRENLGLQNSILLSRALIKSALAREESRGAHYRRDHPAESESFRKQSSAEFDGKDIKVSFEEA